MSTTVVVFLESLLKFSNSNTLNKTRLNQLKPFLNNPNYEFFIYSIGNSFDFNKKIYEDLESVGVKTTQFFAFITGKKLTVFDKIINDLFLKNKEELKQKKEAVISIGAPLNQSDWIQEADFSLLDWPSDSVKPLEQLMQEQLLLTNNLASSNQSVANWENFRSKFFNLGRSKRSFTFSCDAKLQKLLDLIPESEDYIRNLTRDIMELETKQLDLQNQIFIAEKGQTRLLEGQTHLLKELTVHYPLAITETVLTLLVLVLHIPRFPEDLQIVKRWYDSFKAQVNQILCSPKPVITNDSELSVIKIEEGDEIVCSLPNEPLINKAAKSSGKRSYDTSNSDLSSNHSSTNSEETDLSWLFREATEDEARMSYQRLY